MGCNFDTANVWSSTETDPMTCPATYQRTCGEFVESFESLYDARDESIFPDDNPMRVDMDVPVNPTTLTNVQFPFAYNWEMNEHGVQSLVQSLVQSVVVTAISNEWSPQNPGQYFVFNPAAWEATFGSIVGSVGSASSAKVCRDGVPIYTGAIRVFAPSFSNFEGSVSTYIGRRDPLSVSAAGDWRVRDIIVPSSTSCQDVGLYEYAFLSGNPEDLFCGVTQGPPSALAKACDDSIDLLLGSASIGLLTSTAKSVNGKLS